MSQFNQIRRYYIIGSRRISNYWWASVIFLGALGFFLTGLSSYLTMKGYVLPNIKFLSPQILFFPQGLVMSFYGLLGLFLSFYLWLTILWNIGSGYNEFDKKKGIVRILRRGFPGKERSINIEYKMTEVEAIRVEGSENNGQRTIYLKVKGKREIPLNQVGQPIALEEIEKQAAELAKFLQVSVEGLF
jgi:hypothetical protein